MLLSRINKIDCEAYRLVRRSCSCTCEPVNRLVRRSCSCTCGPVHRLCEGLARALVNQCTVSCEGLARALVDQCTVSCGGLARALVNLFTVSLEGLACALPCRSPGCLWAWAEYLTQVHVWLDWQTLRARTAARVRRVMYSTLFDGFMIYLIAYLYTQTFNSFYFFLINKLSISPWLNKHKSFN